MPSLSVVRRNQCYQIIVGLERSILENLVRSLDINTTGFLSPDEQRRALNRLRADMGQSEWELEDVTAEDLLIYLDLGDFVDLLNRHKHSFPTAKQTDIQAAAAAIIEQEVLKIRNRVMHPVRTLDLEDLPKLMSIAKELPAVSQSLIWEPLFESIDLTQDSAHILSFSIPHFWTEETAILHDLPVAEFGDTGFIGRQKEIRQLTNLLKSDHNVITIVGAGGIGKTALALRVCHDILDQPEFGLDRIVWVSLKTQHLTADGIREVTDAVDTTSDLVDHLLVDLDTAIGRQAEPNWDKVLEQLQGSRTLLVVDNLETLGSAIRDLAIGVPHDSKLLLTSRVGLGEIEIRYPMPGLSTRDSIALLRSLANAYNYTIFQTLSEDLLRKYCNRLHYSPLLIKWFVQAVGKGANPEDVLAHEDFNQALRFCWENVYAGLSPLARNIISTLLAARRELSQTEIQELLDAKHIPFQEALQELQQSSILEGKFNEGSAIYQIGSLVFDYLSRYHPPDNSTVKKTREKIRQWQVEKEKSAKQKPNYRYDRYHIDFETSDQLVAAPYLRFALNTIRQNPDAAMRSLRKAEELTPNWWEVHRVKAHLLDSEQRPMYEIEDAFETSIRYKATDTNRYHYATYLLNNGQYEKALEEVESALGSEAAHEVSLNSIRGLANLRLSRLPDALVDLECVWNYEDMNAPDYVMRIRGTQYADALRRSVEHFISQGDYESAEELAIKGVHVADEAASAYGWDQQLASVSVRVLAEVLRLYDANSSAISRFTQVSEGWDSDHEFVEKCRDFRKTLACLNRNADLIHIIPNAYKAALSSDRTQRFTGVVSRILGTFGFVRSDSLGEVHMNPKSLVHPSEWANLREGQQVAFSVIRYVKGPHAVWLEVD